MACSSCGQAVTEGGTGTKADIQGTPGKRCGPEAAAAIASQGVVKKRRRRSSIPNIHWDESQGSWAVHFKNEAGRHTTRKFPVLRFASAGGAQEEEADQAALAAATAFRCTLVQRGLLNEESRAEQPDAPHRSAVRGVCWQRGRGWRAALTINGKRLVKDFRPGDDTPAEFDRAKLGAEEQRRLWDRENNIMEVEVAAKSSSDLVTRTSGVERVTWDRWDECWRVRCYDRSKRNDGAGKWVTKFRRVRPADSSNSAIEQARLEAVELCRSPSPDSTSE